jgi:hypothetical protein
LRCRLHVVRDMSVVDECRQPTRQVSNTDRADKLSLALLRTGAPAQHIPAAARRPAPDCAAKQPNWDRLAAQRRSRPIQARLRQTEWLRVSASSWSSCPCRLSDIGRYGRPIDALLGYQSVTEVFFAYIFRCTAGSRVLDGTLLRTGVAVAV